jgi:hypothetical protein
MTKTGKLQIEKENENAYDWLNREIIITIYKDT